MDAQFEALFSEALDIPISLSIVNFEADKHLAGKQALANTQYFLDGYTSISHSANLAVGVSTPKKENIFGIGIDFEGTRELDIKLSRMFLCVSELRRLNEPTSNELLELWTIKEALFKSTPENDGLFLRNFEIVEKKDTYGKALCLAHPEFQYIFSSCQLPSGILSIALCSIGS